jgi:hypothetical protein
MRSVSTARTGPATVWREDQRLCCAIGFGAQNTVLHAWTAPARGPTVRASGGSRAMAATSDRHAARLAFQGVSVLIDAPMGCQGIRAAFSGLISGF